MTTYQCVKASLEDSETIVEILNRARLTWTVYFPKPEVAHINMFLDLTDEYPDLYKADIMLNNGRVVGGLGMSIEYISNLCIAHNQLLFVEPSLKPVEKYRVIYGLLYNIKPWLKEQGAHRIAWTLGVGKWKSLQRIINRAFPSTQVGVCINSEII